MRHLKGYKLFESDKFSSEFISKVEEAFYNLSDNNNKIVVRKFNYNNRYGKDGSGVLVSIFSKNENGLIGYNDIKDDLDFSIDYCTKELGLYIDYIVTSTITDNKLFYDNYEKFIESVLKADLISIKIVLIN